MNAIDEGDGFIFTLFMDFMSYGAVGEEHEVFDEHMGVEAFFSSEEEDTAVLVKAILDFVDVEVDAALLEAFFSEVLGDLVEDG